MVPTSPRLLRRSATTKPLSRFGRVGSSPSPAIRRAATTEATVQLCPLTVSGAPGRSCSGGGKGVCSGASKATT
jgi:hypothetical protein